MLSQPGVVERSMKEMKIGTKMDEELILLLSKLVFQGKENHVKGILENHINYPDIDLNYIDPFVS